MFGNSSFNNSSFGSTTPFGGSVFGGNPTFGTTFGSTSQTASQPAGPVGTTIRFVPLQGSDTVQKPGGGATPSTVITKHQNISAMKEYESKSVEELRLEDYAANRKVGQSSPFQIGGFGGGGMSLFGQTAQNNTPLFSNPSAASPFKPATNNLFNTPTTSSTASIFNTNTNSSNLFSPNQAPAAQNASPFGATNNSLFNTNSNTTSNAFGNNNLFNNTQPKTGFNLGTTPGTNVFNTGATTSTTVSNASPFNLGNPFNTTTNNANTSGMSLFNNQPSQNNSLFNLNNSNNTNNLFKTPSLAPNQDNSNNPNLTNTLKPSPFQAGAFNTSGTSATGGLSMFGSNNQGNTSLFNNTNTASPFKPATNNLFNNPTTSSTTSIFSTNTNSSNLFSTNQTPAAQTPTPFGATNNSLFNTSSNTTSNAFGNNNLFNNTQPKTGFNLGTTPGANVFNTGAVTTTTPSNASPFNLGNPFNTTTNNANTSGMSLFNNQPSQNNSLFNLNNSNNTSNLFKSPTLVPNQDNSNNSLGFLAQSPQSPNTDLISNRLKTLPYGESSLFLNDSSTSNNVPSFTTDLKTVNKYKMKAKTDIKLNKDAERTNAAMVLFDTEDDPSDDLKCAIEIFPPKRNIKKLDLTLNSDFADERSGFISTRPDYKLDPCLEEIERCYDPKNDTCIVNSLLIDRPEYGSILFDSPLDVKGLNLDEIVFIRRKEVVVYPDDENKPPYGHGLNRPAIVTLHQVWPIDKSTNQMIKDVDRLNLMKYTEKIKSITAEKDARFIDYRPQTGTWVFAVRHFSKYGISDDDDIDFVPPPQPQSHDSTISSQGMIDNSILSDKSLAMSALFDEIEDPAETQAVEKVTPKPSQLSVHKSKRLALHLREPSLTPVRTSLATIPVALPTIMSSVPKQPRTRKLKIVPDLHAARNRPICDGSHYEPRDIMSVCIAGSSKVRFFNGSRKFCIIQGDTVTINELKLVQTRPDGALEDTIKERLEGFLETNSIVTPLNMNPTLAPYIETYDFIPDASSHKLLHALYGNLSSKTPYAKQDERLNRVINWLSSENRKLPMPEGLYQQIIYHMSCDRYDLASTLAIENNHPRLALLVATLNLNKDFIFEQLSSWRLSTADQYIDTELLKIYVLLSGLTEWKLSNDDTIYCLKGLKWTQQLCLLTLHVTSFATEPKKYGFHLLPSYIKRLDTNTNDVDYHILARHNPCQILSAADTLVDEWFLLESLKSYHVINSETECLNSDVIHCNLASQLASIDLRWACFVALHIINNEVRNQVLVQCLEQNYNQLREIKQDSMTVESWLIEKLRVPVEFIAQSKSVASIE